MGGSQRVRLVSSALTSVGQLRANNEDSIHLWGAAEFALAVVADGMGGAAGGEQASQITVEAVEQALVLSEYANRESLESLSESFIADRLQDAIRRANQQITQRVSEHPELRGMGTTVTLAFLRGPQGIVAHVGDSRAYLVEQRARRITQITADHSFVEALVAAGHLTREQAEQHPMKNVLYRALGQSDDIDVDVYEVRLAVNDRLVLCSDGLTRHVQAPEIGDIVLQASSPHDACATLVDLANLRGGEDNVSVIVIKLERDDDDAIDLATVEVRSASSPDEDTRPNPPQPPESPIRAGSAEETLPPRQAPPG